MKRSTNIAPFFAGLLAISLVVPSPARAEEYDDNTATALAKAPAVRHRLLLVKGRFELTPSFEASINVDYRHTVSGGLRAEYHLSDMLSAGLVGFFGTSFNTGLTSKILDSLPDGAVPAGDPTPNRQQYEQHLNSLPVHGALYGTITPWYGKLAAFGKAFVNFDFYFSGGLAVAQLSNTCSDMVCTDPSPGVLDTRGDDDPTNDVLPDNNPNNDPPLNGGLQLGLYLGGGIHVFLNQWIALDLTVRNYMFNDNPSGLDFDADLAVTDTDSRFLNHLFMGVGVSIFFPFKAERTL